VGAGGDDRSVQPRVPSSPNVAHRSGIGLHTALADHAEHELVLAITEAVHGLFAGSLVGATRGQLDTTRRQEGSHTVHPRLAVDVLVVIGMHVKRYECLTSLLGPLSEKGVEHV